MQNENKEKIVFRTENAEVPRGLCLFPPLPADYAVTRGDGGMLVTTIRHLLSELSLIFPEFSEIGTEGIYDDEIADAVSIFQKRTACRVTGNVDRITWNRLVRLYDALPLYIDP